MGVLIAVDEAAAGVSEAGNASDSQSEEACGPVPFLLPLIDG